MAAYLSSLSLVPADLAIAFVVMTIAAAVQGSVGLGGALIAVPFLVLIDPFLVPGPLMIGALVLTLLITYRERRSIDLSSLKWALIGRLPGSAIGAWALTMVTQDEMALSIGGLILLAVVLSISRPGLRPTPMTVLAAGTLSGFMGTVSTIGGPAVALVYQHESGDRIRGTLSGYFVVGAVISLIALGFVGRLGSREFLASLILVPGIVLGYLISIPIAPLLDARYIRPAILTLSSLGALVVIARQLL